MIYGPVTFDSNELFVLGYLALTTVFIWTRPKRFTSSFTVLIMMFSATVARVLDHLLAGPLMVDRYDVMDANKLEYFDLLTYAFYAPSAVLFVYYYDKLNIRGLYFPLYIVGCSLIAVAVESLASLAHVFTYKHWNLYFSFLIYLVVQSLTCWFVRFLQRNGRAHMVK